MTAFLCPKCRGQLRVNEPPWIAGDQASWTSTGTTTYPCPVCKGYGFVQPLPPAGDNQLDLLEARLREATDALRSIANEPPPQAWADAGQIARDALAAVEGIGSQAECPDCGLDLEPGETHEQHEGVGCVATVEGTAATATTHSCSLGSTLDGLVSLPAPTDTPYTERCPHGYFPLDLCDDCTPDASHPTSQL